MKVWLSSIYCEKWQTDLPVTGSCGRLIRPEVSKFWSRKSKNIFLKSLWKLFRKLYSRFLLSSHATALEVSEVLSVAMTSLDQLSESESSEWFLGFSDKFWIYRFAQPNFSHHKHGLDSSFGTIISEPRKGLNSIRTAVQFRTGPVLWSGKQREYRRAKCVDTIRAFCFWHEHSMCSCKKGKIKCVG